jgi:hypothetical protein
MLPKKTKLTEDKEELTELMKAGKQDLMNRYELK